MFDEIGENANENKVEIIIVAGAKKAEIINPA
jgi:hypothetical protein